MSKPLLCKRVEDVPKTPAMDAILKSIGVTELPCTACGKLLIVAGSSMLLVEDGLAEPRCAKTCGPSGLYLPVMTQEQAEELDSLKRIKPTNN